MQCARVWLCTAINAPCSYLAYWRDRFREHTHIPFTVHIIAHSDKPHGLSFTGTCGYHTQQHRTGEQESFYLLDDALPEDQALRQRLREHRLVCHMHSYMHVSHPHTLRAQAQVLAVQQRERDDSTATRLCLFCPAAFSGDRAHVIKVCALLFINWL